MDTGTIITLSFFGVAATCVAICLVWAFVAPVVHRRHLDAEAERLHGEAGVRTLPVVPRSPVRHGPPLKAA